jgi:hypothetical protein
MKTARLLVDLVVVLCLIALGATAPGCTGPNLEANGSGIKVGNGPHNIARQDGGAWETALQAVYPTNTVIDKDGANVQTGGPNTVLGLVLGETPTLFTSNPADTAFEKLTYVAPDGSSIEITGFDSSKSSVIEAWLPGLLQSLQTQGLITEQQAGVWQTAIESGQATVADLIASIVTGGL